MKTLNKIDKYYLLLFVVVVVLAVFVIYTLSVVLSSVGAAQELSNLQTGVVRVNKDNLERAVQFVYDKDVPSLNVRETVVISVEEEVEDEEN